MVEYPKVKVCAAHVAPVFLDAQKTIAKAISLIAEAARVGARLIAFPESSIPGFPVWASVQAPIKNHEYFKAFAAQSIEVPGPEAQQLCDAAREHGIFVSIGISERSPPSVGCLWSLADIATLIGDGSITSASAGMSANCQWQTSNPRRQNIATGCILRAWPRAARTVNATNPDYADADTWVTIDDRLS